VSKNVFGGNFIVTIESVKTSSDEINEHYQVVIIGAGFSGLLCANYLKEAGIRNIKILEMAPSVGGVWSKKGVGAYPGAACDVPSYIYLPLLDRTKFIPSKKYVSQPEIAEYAEMLTDHIGVRENISFCRKVIELRYLGDQQNKWQVATVNAKTGEPEGTITCIHVVSANGPLSSPRMPELGGMESFKGESFHTAQWDRKANLKEKRVAIIGTGASAAQVITSIADEVESLHVFQRTPTWVLRRDDEPTSPELKRQFEAGGYGEELRHIAATKGEFPPGELFIDFDLIQDKEQNETVCKELTQLIESDVDDPETAKLLTPDYPFWCKRVLFIDDYYTSFNKKNVTLIHDDGGVVSVDKTGLTTAEGTHFEFDVIIYATGFDSNYIPFPIYGREGVSLAEKFGANDTNRFQMMRPQSLWGIHVDEMPNFYMMIGPQSLNPLTNVTLLCEQQAQYIANLLGKMLEAGHSRVEPLKEAVNHWSDLCFASAEGKVWLRCNNWYLKTTKTDAPLGMERSSGMWMETYEDYLDHMLRGKAGTQDELLEFT
jgi:cation diffusion facilitator CzcD-associated flavoprotein CzcO